MFGSSRRPITRVVTVTLDHQCGVGILALLRPGKLGLVLPVGLAGAKARSHIVAVSARRSMKKNASATGYPFLPSLRKRVGVLVNPLD